MLENGFLCVGGFLFGLLIVGVFVFYSFSELKTMVVNALRQWIDRK